MLSLTKSILLLSVLLACSQSTFAQKEDPRQKHYWQTVRPILRQHCNSCHNPEDKKGGINLERYDFIISIVRSGELFDKVIDVVNEGSMPPEIRPPMSQAEKDTLTFYIKGYLEAALAEKDPGIISPRRLNNQEYRYTLIDLLGVEIDTDSIFPSDPSGGAGFDNQARILYLSPLLLERYFETADFAVESVYQQDSAWRALVPAYEAGFGEGIKNWWYRFWYEEDVSGEQPLVQATVVLEKFATQAFRRFLRPEEKEMLSQFFEKVYASTETEDDRYDLAVKESLKLILVSHHFLYRQEADPEIALPYEISGFELASRLSFYLWSSIPDERLLNVAYRENLHDPQVLEREVKRMLQDPKAKRMGEQFAIQWLELRKLTDPAFQIDPVQYPNYTPLLRDLMLAEVETYFNYVMLESQNILELIDSDFSFVNEDLAEHYGITDIKGAAFQKISFSNPNRGGLLGMAGILTTTSLPTRTSPVLRGKWVLEQMLGTPAPPPPPNVPELEASHDSTLGPQTLRMMLERHRADPACSSCHNAMDPIGLGLENFDGIGRWRDSYGELPIDPAGVLKSGETFAGPAELKTILLSKKELFARNFSKKMLSFALGRSLNFKDSPT
ncbi:MAG: DUF1592 domain-containing protein, partial [Bacteroidia bacterium]